MTFYAGGYNERFIEETDIQKNLFYDFYADNLLNNLLINDSSELRQIEKEPTGHGINVKNFMEVIYLYYIHKKVIGKKELTPELKLTRAKKMIKKCKITDKEQVQEQIDKHDSKDTWLYESILAKILRLEEDDLCSYISENFICGKIGTNAIRAFEENASAEQIYRYMINELKDSCKKIFDEAEVSHEKLYQMMETRYYLKNLCFECEEAKKSEFYKKCLYFNDKCEADYYEYVKERELQNQSPRHPSEYYLRKCSKCDVAVTELLYQKCPLFQGKCKNKYFEYRSKLTPYEEKKDINDIKNELIKNDVYDYFKTISDLTSEIKTFANNKQLNYVLNKIAKKIAVRERQTTIDELIDSTFSVGNIEKNVTRTKLISLYYYIFMTHCKIEASSFDNFGEFYDEFSSGFKLKFKGTKYEFYGVNSLLEEAGYQEINPKNIFDIVIIFLAIKKLTIMKFDEN